MEHERLDGHLVKENIRMMIGIAIKHRKVMQYHLKKTGLYQAQHRLLMEISRNQHASQKELARLMGVSTAAIAVSLKKLEKGGYILKEVDEADNRLNQISITEKGNRVVEQSKQIFDSIGQRLFEGFMEEEAHTLSGLLKRLDSNLTVMEDEFKLRKRKG